MVTLNAAAPKKRETAAASSPKLNAAPSSPASRPRSASASDSPSRDSRHNKPRKRRGEHAGASTVALAVLVGVASFVVCAAVAYVFFLYYDPRVDVDGGSAASTAENGRAAANVASSITSSWMPVKQVEATPHESISEKDVLRVVQHYIFAHYEEFSQSLLTFRHLKQHLSMKFGISYEDLSKDDFEKMIEDAVDVITNTCNGGSVSPALCAESLSLDIDEFMARV